ncbi:hypothetical protein P167DRAFT_579693 [Morchella conica CCBAS932]|uniref:SPX domain-containing protein n=1 Tax=Morchella conica CCBAS932 TaxID=1392247 RepID=A0A3N4KMK6_9PEZI|nr:hypothetical protein P167DRAFT_579693 [Morchella conica CCBAS932]
MKFGEALPQRSVPEWLPYNLDYSEIKQLIKRYTTGKPLVQVPELKTGFEDEFFEIFMDQLGRIDLFVKSKAGEIDRRIVRCNKQVAPLRRRDPTDGFTSRKASRYAKVEQEVERVSYEIQSLSRFVNVQHTGFIKLLKKYKKWTGSSHLTTRFLPILESPTSFHKIDFEKNVLDLSDLLIVVRSGFDSFKLAALTGQYNRSPKETTFKDSQSCDNGNSHTITSESQAYIDTVLAMSASSGGNGGKATFWVHYDHLIEVQVLLMKYLTLQTTSPSSSIPSTPLAHRDSWLGPVGKDDEVGVVVLDDLDSFSDVQSTATIAEVNKAGLRTAGQIRWCSRDSEAVVVVSDASSTILNGNDAHSGETLEVKMKRKHVQGLLEMVSPGSDSYFELADAGEAPKLKEIKGWFARHKNVAPLVKILTKRTRFADTPDGSPVWALLDWDIRMFKITKGMQWMNDPGVDDLGRGLRNGTTMKFPHAVLEVQWEGEEMPGLVRELETSHMVENVRGFSLDVHAVAELYRPKKMTAPFWVSALQKDIRKTPIHTPRHSRRSSAHLIFAPNSKAASVGGSTAAHDFTDGFDSSATAYESGSGTGYRNGRKYNRTKSGLSEIESIGGERYWSEFNDATDNEEEPYTIIVSRKASSDDGFDDDDTLGEFIKKGFVSTGIKIQRFFIRSPETRAERRPLLRKPSMTSSLSSGEVDVETGMLLSTRSAHRRRAASSRFDVSQSSTYRADIYCLAGSVFILSVTAILAMNSTILSHKHKWRKRGFTVDIEVCSAVLVALIMAGTGLVMFLTKRLRVGVLYQAMVWLAFASVCIGSGVIFAIVGESEV